MNKLSPVSKLLRELIAIPSVNPDGNPGTDKIKERAMAEFTADWLRKHGAAAKLDFIEKDRPNVLGVYRGAGKVKRRVLFAPHLDTVSVLGMTIDPFDPVVKNGRIYGRGATDTKGSFASMLVALDTFAKKGIPDGLEITFAGLMGEEAGNAGAIEYAKKSPFFDLVIAGEPTDFKAIHAHKGTVWLAVQAKGKAVHASIPEKGSNAIDAMTEIMCKLSPFLKKNVAAQRDPLLGSATFNFGTIHGGSKINIVPDQCTLAIDIRYLPKMKTQKLISDICKLVRPAKVELRGSSLPLHTPKDHPMLKLIQPAVKGLGVVPWFCDAAFFAQRGMAAIALGPGSIVQAHTNDEFIEISDLEDGVEGFGKLLARL